MAKKIRKCPKEPKGAPAWMVTYGDMVTLLLTFFVLMLSFAEVDGRQFRLVMSAFQGSLGVFQGGKTLSKGELEEMGMRIQELPSVQKGNALSKAIKDAISMFEPEIEARKVRVQEDERGIIISLMNDAYFAPGSAIITEALQRTLVKVGKLLVRVAAFVRIEGHTDNRPIPITGVREGYETNWELSGGRAINVLRFLSENEGVDPRKMSAVSFGSTRPLYPNDTPERRSFNRRVDIVILKKRYEPRPDSPGLPDSPLPDEEWRDPTR